ncbi:sensor domain-containing diguanylate cyclase [Pseudonocardia sp. TRM90224]|uniref:sensor domain-containing diguanylate cyclase n=1 Tax=Pseudonocardia sp. TRM90224 TaxID=2812678 RepID=UPI001E2FD044|nr:GGDEF domain-containing protein [Pseudonocardia sp. TRM90224]
MREWPLWRLPPRLIAPMLLMEATALTLVVVGVLGGVPTHAQLVKGAIVVVAGLLHAEAALRIERVRRRISEGNHVDLSSVWTFAGSLLLPSAYAAIGAGVIWTHLWMRTWRHRRPVFREIFTTATVALASYTAATVMQHMTGGPLGTSTGSSTLPAILAALLLYTTVNSCLIAGAIAMSSTSKPDLATVFAPWDENLLEIATLALGALTAAALVINPWLIGLLIPPMFVLHLSALVRQLRVAATLDSKTGLLNAAAWHTRAAAAVGRNGNTSGVLVIDLDHFKAVNDTFGHPAGDAVLSAVADQLRAETREQDVVGRFGGEEFVVLLGGVTGGVRELGSIAERIRRRIAAMELELQMNGGTKQFAGLTASIGGALQTGDCAELADLLRLADTALYAAKNAGRNTVRLGSIGPRGTTAPGIEPPQSGMPLPPMRAFKPSPEA